MTLHFICRGNVLRSLIAETYLKSLELPNVTVISSGTGVDYFGESDMPYFETTTQLLRAHGLGKFIKPKPEQLTQERLDSGDMTVCLNSRVVSDAKTLPVTLPENTIVWEVVDIGEGTRIEKLENGRVVEEVIYDEITAKVDELAKSLVAQDALK